MNIYSNEEKINQLKLEINRIEDNFNTKLNEVLFFYNFLNSFAKILNI
jgi:hypothetical protein